MGKGRSVGRVLAVTVGVLLVMSGITAVGCKESVSLGSNGETGAVSTGSEDGEAGNVLPKGKVIHACGRSVLAGWMEHGGWDGDPAIPFRFEGFDFYYHEVDQPPGISGDAREVMREAGDGSIVFFKLCFADFEGGDESTARANLRRNQAIIDALVECSRGMPGQVLLLGNALPVVREYCDEWMVWNQRSYNDHLRGIAETNPQVRVIDLYGALAAPDGSLDTRFAADRYDSHLNAAGYAVMDQAMRSTLSELH